MSLTFILTTRCGLCGYVCKGMQFASGCRVCAPFCRECNHPRMDGPVQRALTAESEQLVDAARAKRGWLAVA